MIGTIVVETAYLVVTLIAVAATGFMAVADLARADFVLENSASVGVSERWLAPLGLIKGAGAVGLLVGLAGITVIGQAAAVGLVAFFVGAVVTHLRAGNLELQFPLAFLGLATASLALSIAS